MLRKSFYILLRWVRGLHCCSQLTRLAIVVLLSTSAKAQLLDDTEVRKHRQSSQPTQHRFQSDISLMEQAKGTGLRFPEGKQGSFRVPLPTLLYSPTEQLRKPGEGTFDGLAACEGSEVRYGPLFSDERGFENLNVLVYHWANKQDKQRSIQYPRLAIPYIEGAMVNPYRDPSDHAQSMLRVLGIRCLPTAVKEVKSGETRKLEYREGEAAWRVEK